MLNKLMGTKVGQLSTILSDFEALKDNLTGFLEKNIEETEAVQAKMTTLIEEGEKAARILTKVKELVE